MSLTLSVLTYRNQPPQRPISTRFSGIGGTIGRLDQNDLVLPDPERVVSRTHARVEFRDGSYFLTSLGQNPIDVNGRPLGPGGTAELASGDRLTIGGYCIVADMQPDEPIASRIPADTLLNPTREPAGLDFPLSAEAESRMAFGIDLGGGAPAFTNSESQPLKPLSSHGVQRDELPGFLEPLPRAVPAKSLQIPDDYDLLRGLEGQSEPLASPLMSPRPSPLDAAEPNWSDPFGDAAPAEGPPISPSPALNNSLGAPGTNAARERNPEASRIPGVGAHTVSAMPARADDAYAQAVRALLQAAGVPELEERALANAEFMQCVGELLRESVAGLLKALVARALTKRELRVDMTMLATTENNPLKFCPDAFEALTHLLAPRARSGYLPPLRAVREAYEDLQAHNLAVMAGMRAALLGVLQRFDPGQLENRLASHPLLDKLLPQNRKARMWDMVAEQHGALVREAQDEFDRIFGRAFRAAYEEQLQKLRAASGRGRSSV
jgi:FHA domain-containing protein/type VI secretion system protein